MVIKENSVVSIHYTLTLTDGKVVDSSAGGEPLTYIQGFGEIIPGLENSMAGRQIGDKFKVTIPCVDGYGERNDGLIQALPRDLFQGVDDIQTGMQFQADTPNGNVVFTVLETNDTEIKVDGNHPMAGQDLVFDIDVVSVREATQEELDAASKSECGSEGCSSCSGCGH